MTYKDERVEGRDRADKLLKMIIILAKSSKSVKYKLYDIGNYMPKIRNYVRYHTPFEDINILWADVVNRVLDYVNFDEGFDQGKVNCTDTEAELLITDIITCFYYLVYNNGRLDALMDLIGDALSKSREINDN